MAKAADSFNRIEMMNADYKLGYQHGLQGLRNADISLASDAYKVGYERGSKDRKSERQLLKEIVDDFDGAF